MTEVGLWQVAGQSQPAILQSASIALEEHLENWIERDPGLVEAGLAIVGRQIRLETGPLDLLGIDPQGRWVAIELKRARLYRETLAQALGHAACLATLDHDQLMEIADAYLTSRQLQPHSIPALETARSEDEAEAREVRIVLVGTIRDASLDRLVQYVGRFNIPLTIVSFKVFELPSGEQVLLRELADSEVELQQPRPSRVTTTDQVLARAEQKGIGVGFRAIKDAATKLGCTHGLGRDASCMQIQPSATARCLRFGGTGGANIWQGTPTIAAFLGIKSQEAEQLLGQDGWRKGMSDSDLHEYADALLDLARRTEPVDGATARPGSSK